MSSEPMQPSLVCQDIHKQFNGTPVVQRFNLTVEAGQLVTLLGPSGCGKTTSLRLIAGFERPDSGRITLNGRSVYDGVQYVPAEKRQIGMVFQDYALFPHLDVAGNIAFGFKGERKARQQRVQELLELVGMSEYGQRMPHELSGGQQQRVALARALAPAPSILLLDEPFSNLDTALRKQVRAEIRSILRKAGTTTVFVTHDQEEALSLSDRIAVIFEGEVRQLGTPDRIYNYPADAQIAAFIGEANFIPAEASGTRAQSPLGEMRLLQPAQGAVRLLLRPEIVHIEPTVEGVPARVLWREYYGHNQRVGLELEDGTPIIARTDAQIVYKVGDQVRVSVYAPLLAFRM